MRVYKSMKVNCVYQGTALLLHDCAFLGVYCNSRKFSCVMRELLIGKLK